jgi:hypothetical protein
MVRLGNNPWLRKGSLFDVTSVANAELAEPQSSIQLTSAFLLGCVKPLVTAQVFGHDSRAYILYRDFVWERPDGTAIAVVDLTQPASPKLEANTIIHAAPRYTSASGNRELAPFGERVVQLGTTFVVSDFEQARDASGQATEFHAWLDVVDASEPAAISTQRMDLSFPNTHSGGLLVDGSRVLTSHYEPEENGRVRFYIDRLDVSNPKQPRWLDKLNVPGSLLAWDPASSRAITVGYRRDSQDNMTQSACFELRPEVGWTADATDPTRGTCTMLRYAIQLARLSATSAVLEGSWDVPAGLFLLKAAAGDGRLFVSLGRGRAYSDEAYRCPQFNCTLRPAPGAAVVLVLSGLREGVLRVAPLELGEDLATDYGWPVLLPYRKAALLGVGDAMSSFLVIDAKVAGAPRVARRFRPFGQVYEATKHGDQALLSLRSEGVQVVDIGAQ